MCRISKTGYLSFEKEQTILNYFFRVRNVGVADHLKPILPEMTIQIRVMITSII
jgi:hypothetical protein